MILFFFIHHFFLFETVCFTSVLFSLLLQKMSEVPLPHKGGRPFTEVWDGHMIKGSPTSRGHYAATCSYCNNSWKQGKPQVLREHLANHCKGCPPEVSLHFAKIVGKAIGEKMGEDDESASDLEEPSHKRQKQTSINNFYKSDKKLEKGYSDAINHSVTKAFVMCNIPFSVIENPWFIDMLKTLQPSYVPPSRKVLSGTLLEAEVSRVNLQIFNELARESNCTIGKILIFTFNFFINISSHNHFTLY
jgi:hypothetical protein